MFSSASAQGLSNSLVQEHYKIYISIIFMFEDMIFKHMHTNILIFQYILIYIYTYIYNVYIYIYITCVLHIIPCIIAV